MGFIFFGIKNVKLDDKTGVKNVKLVTKADVKNVKLFDLSLNFS